MERIRNLFHSINLNLKMLDKDVGNLSTPDEQRIHHAEHIKQLLDYYINEIKRGG